MKKVFIAGTFDIIHPGHLSLIKQARELGDFLVAVIARDKQVVRTKGREPYFNEDQRLKQLKKLGLIDKVILGDLTDQLVPVKKELPDIIALGYDQDLAVKEKLIKEGLKIKVKVLKPFKADVCKSRNIRKAFEDNQAGFLLIKKQEGWTSHDVVAKLRTILQIKQIGHTGTLDPMATGLLICAVNKATKMIGLFDALPKTYEAEIKLGITSDTFDRTGKLKITNESIKISKAEIIRALKTFSGRQSQLPPMYSAKKVNGQRLYKLARKGLEVKRQTSEIEIYNIRLLSFKNNILKIRVVCSAGTYIRTLAHDLGQNLKTGAVLNELSRTAIGNFKLAQAVSLTKLTKNNYSKYLIKPEDGFKFILCHVS